MGEIPPAGRRAAQWWISCTDGWNPGSEQVGESDKTRQPVKLDFQIYNFFFLFKDKYTPYTTWDIVKFKKQTKKKYSLSEIQIELGVAYFDFLTTYCGG